MDIKLEKYRDLLKWKNIFMISPLMLPVSIFILKECLYISDFIAIWVGFSLSGSFMFISGFTFLAKNICPWCGDNFFFKNGLMYLSSSLFKNKCVHCGEPKKTDKCNKHT